MKKFAVVGGLIFLVGCIMFCATMGALNWDFTKLSNRPPFEEKTMVLDNNSQTITLKSSNVEIHIAQSQDDKIHFIYSEREKEVYEFDTGNTITIKKSYKYQWYEYLSVMDLHREKPFTILLPANFAGKLDLTTSNSKVEIKDVSPQNIEAVTSNGAVVFSNIKILDSIVVKTSNNTINLNGVHANGKIDMTTSNGSVSLNDISAKAIAVKASNDRIYAKNLVALDDLNLKTSNSAIEFDLISANKSIILATSNYSIKGVLTGKMSDYNITSKTSNGKNNLPERMPDGQTELKVSTSNDDIDILFNGE